MKEFPKKLYLTATVDETENIDDYIVYENANNLASQEEEGSEVAVYELVKLGKVKKYSKVAFE